MTNQKIKLTVRAEKWAFKNTFRITGLSRDENILVVVTLERGDNFGWGEAAGVRYLEDAPDKIIADLEAARSTVEAGIDRAALQELLPAGGARNALDCALWDLEAQEVGRPVWALAGIDSPKPLLTTFTCGAEAPQVMAATALAFSNARALKLKLTGVPEDGARVRAVRAARPDAWIAVDANQGFTQATLEALMPTLVACEIALIEQPFPIGKEEWLDDYRAPIPIALDESVQTRADLEGIANRCQMFNIKLDKCGGLTEALEMARAGRALGLDVMIGNMIGTSLAMCPAFIVGQLARIVDLDGPALLKHDRSPAVSYRDGLIDTAPCPWGEPTSLQAWVT